VNVNELPAAIHGLEVADGSNCAQTYQQREALIISGSGTEYAMVEKDNIKEAYQFVSAHGANSHKGTAKSQIDTNRGRGQGGDCL
jgi:hypothetical protein